MGSLQELLGQFIRDLEISLEAIVGDVPIYIVLTDTKTTFSKISKWVTKQPYNHVSLAFTEDMGTLYTYAIVTTDNGRRGGVKVERRELLAGAHYSLYRLDVNEGVALKVKSLVDSMVEYPPGTRYNHLALINAVLGKPVFKSDSVNSYICSQFIVEVLREAGVPLFKGRDATTVKPYDLVKYKALKHVRRGKFK